MFYASLFGVGAPEALVIGVVALLVFGPKGLAEVRFICLLMFYFFYLLNMLKHAFVRAFACLVMYLICAIC